MNPNNLLISKDVRLNLCDMGITKRMVPQPIDGLLTRAGYIVGTLCNAAIGHTIHQADNMFSLFMKQANEPAKDPREVMPGLDDAFCKLLLLMLNLDREKRPANWTVAYDELATIHERLTLARASAPIRISSADRAEPSTHGDPA